jgi:hypothetical protein
LTTGLREYRVLTRAACRFVESVRPLHTAVQAKLRQRRFPRSSSGSPSDNAVLEAVRAFDVSLLLKAAPHIHDKPRRAELVLG